MGKSQIPVSARGYLGYLTLTIYFIEKNLWSSLTYFIIILLFFGKWNTVKASLVP